MFVSEANSDRVLLNDVNVLTLHHGQSTKARRSSPVPQVSLCTYYTVEPSFRTLQLECDLSISIKKYFCQL